VIFAQFFAITVGETSRKGVDVHLSENKGKKQRLEASMLKSTQNIFLLFFFQKIIL